MMSIKKKAPRVIIDHILEDIEQGKLSPGQLLPSQNELCDIYNTGRGSVREALQALELVDVIEVKPGIGAYIKPFSINSFFNPARINYRPDDELVPDLLEFRELFESIVVQSAINNATEQDLKDIEENLELTSFYIKKENKEEFVRLDYQFHQKLSDATHNKVIKKYFDVIFPLLKYCMTEILIKTTAIPGVMQRTYQDHNNVFIYLKQKQGDKAVDSIKAHLKFVKNNYKQIQQSKPDLEHQPLRN
ncbi:MAG: FadR family transcriptional regulator [Actinomycetia bacterium]|nr:FadR family transcriptional regulator [Actinomycetes bacterium]